MIIAHIETTRPKPKTRYYIIPIVFIVWIFLCSLVPGRRIAVAMLFAPDVVELIKSDATTSKAEKINSIIDKALSKADEYLEKDSK